MALFNVPGLSDFVAPRRNALLGLASGLARGTDLSQGLAYGFQGAAQGQQADDAWATSQKAEAERQRQIEEASALKAKYAEFFTKQGRTDIAQGIADGIVEPGAAYMDFIKPKGADAPANIQEWNAYSAMTPEQKAEFLRMKRATPYLDIGTGFVSPDPLNPGATSGPEIVKDNYTPKRDEALGTGDGKTAAETQAAFDSLNSKLPGLKSVVGELGDLAEKATYTTAGKLWDDVVRESGAMPTEGALARTKYMSMVDNQVLPLLRDTFGAAFTVQEGESLRATLGAPDKSPDEKKAVLEAFIEQKTRDLEALGRRLPGSKAPAATGGNTTSSGVTWKVK
jgi:hypothetical protein